MAGLVSFTSSNISVPRRSRYSGSFGNRGYRNSFIDSEMAVTDYIWDRKGLVLWPFMLNLAFLLDMLLNCPNANSSPLRLIEGPTLPLF